MFFKKKTDLKKKCKMTIIHIVMNGDPKKLNWNLSSLMEMGGAHLVLCSTWYKFLSKMVYIDKVMTACCFFPTSTTETNNLGYVYITIMLNKIRDLVLSPLWTCTFFSILCNFIFFPPLFTSYHEITLYRPQNTCIEVFNKHII